jgi:hypothetical protein
MSEASVLKSTNIIQNNSRIIVQNWVENDSVKNILNSKNISIPVFTKHFASKIVEHLVQVLYGRAKIGDCPTIWAMLMFFEQKNIELNELYIICDTLKENIILELLQNNHSEPSSISHVFNIFSVNFSSIIKEYIYQNYERRQKPIGSEICDICDKGAKSDMPTPCLSKTKSEEKMLKVEYIKISAPDIRLISKAVEALDRYAYLYSLKKSTLRETEKIIEELGLFGTKLKNAGFEELGNNLERLSHSLAQQIFLFAQNHSFILFLLDSILNDLEVWHASIVDNNNKASTQPHVVFGLEQMITMVEWEAKKYLCKFRRA